MSKIRLVGNPFASTPFVHCRIHSEFWQRWQRRWLRGEALVSYQPGAGNGSVDPSPIFDSCPRGQWSRRLRVAGLMDTGKQDLGSQDGVIPIVEETARIDKRAVQTGRVRVRTIVDEEPVVVSAILSGNYVTVDRVAIGRVVEAVPPPRTIDGVTIISVVEERLRVVRELVLVEEIHMRDVQTSEPFEQTLTRRVMRAEMEREPTNREID